MRRKIHEVRSVHDSLRHAKFQQARGNIKLRERIYEVANNLVRQSIMSKGEISSDSPWKTIYNGGQVVRWIEAGEN